MNKAHAPSALQPASRGAGPLYQRDYWAVIDRCRCRPSEVIALITERFAEFPPADTVEFRRSHDAGRPLEVGDEFDIRIRMAGICGVRVIHKDACRAGSPLVPTATSVAMSSSTSGAAPARSH